MLNANSSFSDQISFIATLGRTDGVAGSGHFAVDDVSFVSCCSGETYNFKNQ